MSSSYQSASPRRRALGIALAVVAHLIVLLVMLTMAPRFEKDDEEPTSFTMFDVPNPVPTPGPKAPEKKVVEEKKPAASGAAGRAPTPDTPVAPPAPPTPPMPMIVLGRETFAATDIAKLTRRGEGDAGASKGKNSASAYGPGEGQGGERLYNAEWEREPSRAEMITYLSSVTVSEGAGLIACKTIPGNRVENCRSLGDAPLGSGISRAMRLAAWQFRIIPPRVNGEPQMGAWVRIRFELTRGVAH